MKSLEQNAFDAETATLNLYNSLIVNDVINNIKKSPQKLQNGMWKDFSIEFFNLFPIINKG